MSRGPLLSLLVAAACTEPTESGAAPETADSSPDSGSPVAPRPTLSLPPDAEDADPAPAAETFTLAAQLLDHEVGGIAFPGYGVNGLSPGPVLRAAIGDTVTVELHNELVDPTTLHWHGLAAPNAMDGVAWMQTPIPEGGAFTYTLPVNEAGTFWYHPHVDTARQVDLGLYGAFVVTDPAEPVADLDAVLVFDAWAEFDSANGAADDHTPPDPATVAWTVNGAEDPLWTLPAGTRARVRLINAANTSYLSITWPGARQIGGEQGLLAAPLAVEGLVLAPGDRAELEVDAGGGTADVTTALWSAAGGAAFGEPRRLLTVESGTEAADPLPFAFSGELPTADPGKTDLVYVFQGGAPDTDWLINGEAWPDVTVQHLAVGQDAILELRNLSATNHPFHLHGNRFEVLSIDGVAPANRRWEDTIDLPIRSVTRVRMPATNPGRWALHCHLLGHEQGGMLTELDVD